MNKNEPPQKESKTFPAYKLHFGSLGVAVWRHRGTERDYYSVVLERSFRRKDNPAWETTRDLREQDVPLARALLLSAENYIFSNPL
jgi:hypothetical protein